MFVENHTALRAHLGRASLEENPRLSVPLGLAPQPAPDRTRRFATLTVHEAFGFEGGSLVRMPALLPPELELTMQATATNGTCVMATGMVEGTSRGTLAQRVTLRVGRDAVQLVCRSARTWERTHAGFVPSKPTAFDPFPLTWTEAFGGVVATPPGVDPHSKLPHPGFTSADLYNPLGKGLVLREEHAEGTPLPRVELLSEQMLRPLDRPIPGGLAPCAEVVSLRWRNPLDERTHFARRCHQSPFVGYHAGSLQCVFEDLSAGTEVAIEGLVGGPLRLLAPRPRTFVRWDSRERGASGSRLRTLLIDSERRVVHVLVQHAILMPGDTLPRGATLGERDE